MILPSSIRRLFYRYHADRLDPERHAAIICRISRFLPQVVSRSLSRPRGIQAAPPG